jgi:hypothetical protein
LKKGAPKWAADLDDPLSESLQEATSSKESVNFATRELLAVPISRVAHCRFCAGEMTALASFAIALPASAQLLTSSRRRWGCLGDDRHQHRVRTWAALRVFQRSTGAPPTACQWLPRGVCSTPYNPQGVGSPWVGKPGSNALWLPFLPSPGERSIARSLVNLGGRTERQLLALP